MLVVLAVAVVLAISAPASAFAETNNTANGRWWGADGPARSGVKIAGTLSNADDVDFYYFYVGTASDVTVSFNRTDYNADFEWFRFDGGALVSQATAGWTGSASITKRLTAGLYYLEFASGSGSYDFTASGSGITLAPAVGSPTHGVHTDRAEDFAANWTDAQGPAGAGVTQVADLSASFDDVDFYYFYVGTTSDVTLGFNRDNYNAEFEWFRFDGGTLVSQGTAGWTGSASVTKRLTPGLYYVKFWGSAGAYDFTASGPGIKLVPAAGSPIHGAHSHPDEDFKTSWTAAQGLLGAGVTQVADLAASFDDVDWYRFRVGTTSDVTLGFNRDNYNAEFEWFRLDGSTLVSQGTAGWTGSASSTKRLAPGLYYVKFWGSAGAYDFTASGTGITTASVATPVAPSTMSHSRYYTVYGTLQPRHIAGTYPVRIYKYRYVSGHWKSYGYVLAKATNYYSYSKYSRSIKLAYRGRWRVRAYAPADAAHKASWSNGYDYVTVK